MFRSMRLSAGELVDDLRPSYRRGWQDSHDSRIDIGIGNLGLYHTQRRVLEGAYPVATGKVAPSRYLPDAAVVGPVGGHKALERQVQVTPAAGAVIGNPSPLSRERRIAPGVACLSNRFQS